MLDLIDDETDMKALEESVRGIQKDGLVWGASKLVAVGFGIKKLQINLVVEDEKVSLDELQEEIQEFEDYVQSSDVVCHPFTRLISKEPRANTQSRLPCRSCKYPMSSGRQSIKQKIKTAPLSLMNTNLEHDSWTGF